MRGCRCVPIWDERSTTKRSARLVVCESSKTRISFSLRAQDLQRDLEHVSQFGLKVFSNADTVVRWLIRRSNEHASRCF